MEPHPYGAGKQQEVTQQGRTQQEIESDPGRAIPHSTNVVKLRYFHFGMIFQNATNSAAK